MFGRYHSKLRTTKTDAKSQSYRPKEITKTSGKMSLV